MQLTSLIIRGYKNLTDLTLDFSAKEGIALIIGNNGSGKSNIIEAISAIFSGLYKRNAPRYKPGFSYAIAYEVNNRNIKVDYDSVNFTYSVDGQRKTKGQFFNEELANLPSQVIAAYSGEETRLYTKYYQPFYDDFKYVYLKYGQVVQKQFYVNKYYWQLALVTLIYAAQNPENTDVQEFLKTELNIDPVEDVTFRFNPLKRENYNATPTIAFIDEINTEAGTPATLVPRDLYFRQDQNPDTGEVREVPERWGSPKDFFNLISTAYLPKNKKFITDISVRYKEGLNSSEFSEGEKKLILIKFIFEYLANEDALILLDEPDAHIHISRKQNLKALIMAYKGKRSCILTTHSPTLLECFNTKHHIQIDKDGAGNVIVNNQVSELRESIERLTDGKWSYAEETIFTSTTKDILLFEGKYDVRYIRRAIDALNNTKDNKFNTFNFTMAHCGGTGNVVAFFEDVVLPVIRPNQLCIVMFDDDGPGRDGVIALEKIKVSKGLSNVQFITYPKTPARKKAKDFLLEDHFPVATYKQRMEQKIQAAGSFSDLNSQQKAKNIIEDNYLHFPDTDFDAFEPLLDLLTAKQAAFHNPQQLQLVPVIQPQP